MTYKTNSQSGVALMMSVLILAAITAIAFSLSTIVFIELRASRDVVRSEPALYATLGVTEEALFQYKRFIDASVFDVATCYPQILEVCELNGVSLDSPLPEILSESEVPLVKTIFAGETKEFPLFSVSCPVQDPDCSWDSAIGAVSFELVPVGNVNASINITADWIDITGTQGTTTIATGMNEGSNRVDWPVPVLTNRQYIVKITNTDIEQNAQVSIWSYDSATPSKTKGLPFVASKVLKIVADYSGLTRTYRVDIPIGNVSLGSATINDFVYVADDVPLGATTVSDGDPWNWVSSNPTPFSGSLSHQSALVSGIHQHYFHSSPTTMVVNTGDVMVQYIYIDPANPPRQVMIQWGSTAEAWNHRAYWGENLIGWGTDGTSSRRYMGPLPSTGSWVRLEIPASQVGLEGLTVNAMAYTLYDGQATWDHSGKKQ